MQPEATALMSETALGRVTAGRRTMVRTASGEVAGTAESGTAPEGRKRGRPAKVRPSGGAQAAAEKRAVPPGAGDAALAETLDALATSVAVRVRAQTRRITELELALADAEARILSQAQLICAATLGADGDLFSRRPVRGIVEEVLAAYPGIRWDEVIGVGRERRLVEPRHRCMVAVYEERPDLSLPALGRIFNRDHTSVLHAVNKADKGGKAGHGTNRPRTGRRGRAGEAKGDRIAAAAF